MKSNYSTGIVFITTGTLTGAAISSTVGGIGIAGGFGAVGIGATSVTAIGAVFGAAAYGAFTGITQADPAVFGTMGIGAVSGFGIANIIGNLGFVAPKIGLAFGIGTLPMVGIGAVLGLASYGVVKLLDDSQFTESSTELFTRMETKILQNDYYFQALLELSEIDIESKYTALEIEDELQQLKAKINGKSPENPSTNKSKNQSENQQKMKPIIKGMWQCIKTLKGHKSHVNDIAIHPDHQTLVSGSDDKQVNLWNLQTGKLLYTFCGQAEAVLSVAISPDGKYLISGSVDRKISKWELATKKYHGTFSYLSDPYSHKSFVNDLVYSPHGNIIVSASSDKTLKIWGSSTKSLQRTLNGHTDAVLTVAISADGKKIVSGSADQNMIIWDVETGKICYINRHLSAVNTLAITPDNHTIISGSADGKIQLWNLNNGELWYTLENHSRGISGIAIHPNGKIVAISSQEGIIQLWNIETRELLATLSGISPLVFSQDGKMFISGGENGTIKIWQHIHNDDHNDYNLPLIGEWWEILGVNVNASYQDVKLAYLRLAKLYHPDLNNSTNAKAAMQAVNQAYQKFQNRVNSSNKY